MTARHLLDYRIGVPWSEADLHLVSRVSGSAWANPQHPASEGRRAALWLEAAQASVRALTGFEHVYFHASRDAALRAVIDAHGDEPVVTAATNRESVLALATEIVSVDSDGAVVWPGTGFVIAQGANEETGVLDALPALGVLDASNSFGRTPRIPDVETLVADSASWGAPGNIALVLSRKPLATSPAPPLPLVALAVSRLEAHWSDREARFLAEEHAMATFESRVRAWIPDVQVHGVNRVPYIRSLSVLHLDAETLMRELDTEGFALGSGSACVADGRPSHVLAAMGGVTHGNLRLALPVDCNLHVLERFAEVLATTVTRLRREAGVSDL